MFRSLSYKGSLLANYPTMTQAEAFYDTSDNILIGKEIMSETYYAGDKGDEVSDYSFNFKLGITSNIKSTSVFVYSADLKRATAASTTDAMFRSLSYKGSLLANYPTMTRTEAFYDTRITSSSARRSCPRPTTPATRATRYRTTASTSSSASPRT